MASLLHSHSPFRIFFISGLLTIFSLIGIAVGFGSQALFITFVLILVEVTFSFDNAIINARILAGMSRFWQQMFLTVGVLIAVFGMRLVFPILLVATTTGLSATGVVDLAINQPEMYAAKVTEAHPYIASFGGMFLLMLALSFFFDPGRKVTWIDVIERPLMRMGKWWLYTLIAGAILGIITILPWNTHPKETMIAGSIGIVLQLAMNMFNNYFSVSQSKSNKTSSAWAGFISFMYLQVLDASFSFDGVIGAFAITKDVLFITVGLGIGALWVRSLTILMTRRRTLETYRYLEHGAHYTIGVLAFVLLGGLFIHVPEAIAGVAGVLIVGASVISSVLAARMESHKRN